MAQAREVTDLFPLGTESVRDEPDPTYMLTRRGDRLVEQHRADITLEQAHQLLFEREGNGRDRAMRPMRPMRVAALRTLSTLSENVARPLGSGSRDGSRSEKRQVLRQ